MRTQLNILRYLAAVFLQLPGSWKQKKQILLEIKNSIQSYAFEEDYISYRQIRSRFGDPEQVASAYLTELPPEELLEKVKTKMAVVRILIGAAIIGAVLWVAFLAACFLTVQRDANGYTVVEIVEITRSE